MPKKIINLKWAFSYTVLGKGTPIVLLHGIGGHSSQWHEYAVALSSYHTVIVPNLNHLYQSKERLAFSKQVGILKEFLDDIGKEYGMLSIAGQSYGGALAYAVAIAEKDIVESLILINPIPPWPIHYLKNSFLRFFVRTSTLLSELKSGLLKTQVGIQFLKELRIVFPWPWLIRLVDEENFSGRRFKMLHAALERMAWIFQKENWDNWSRWDMLADRVLLIYDPKDPLFNPLAYPDMITKFKIEHVIKLKHSGHILVSENKFEIQLGIRRFLEAGYADDFKIKPEGNQSSIAG